MRKTTLTGLCLILSLPAWGQRGGAFGGGGIGMAGGGIGFGSGAVLGSGFGRGGSTVVGFGNGPFGGFGAFSSPGFFGSFGSPFGFGFGNGVFANLGVPFGFGFGTGVFARIRGPFSVGFGTPQSMLNVGIPPLGGGLPSLGVNAPASAFFRGLLAEDTFPGWSLPFYPFGYGGYDYGNGMAQPASPNIIVMQPFSPEMMAQRAKPPEPARLEIREVKATAAAEPTAPLTPQQMFSIALKNGARDSARAAWVQDECLYYVNPSGRREQVALGAVDRPTTERLNRDKNLSLWLPPE